MPHPRIAENQRLQHSWCSDGLRRRIPSNIWIRHDLQKDTVLRTTKIVNL
jgi:hypothetical protein